MESNTSDTLQKAPQPERSDEPENPEAESQSQEPGFSQKTNQNEQKEDPLAA
jgi:hypothetical protein